MNNELWQNIPPDSDVVLYFGCGDGKHPAALKQRYPDMLLIAVGNDDALRQQAQACDFVVVETAFAAWEYIAQCGKPVDAWLVERTAWQDGTFTLALRRQLFACMQSGATVIWEMANNRYWRHVAALLRGTPDDIVRPGLPGLLAELRQAGISGIEVQWNAAEEASADFARFLSLVQPLASALHISDDELEKALRSDSLWLRGWRQVSLRNPVMLTTVYGETKVCSRVRIDEPHAFLATLPKIKFRGMSNPVGVKFATTGREVWIWQRRTFSRPDMLNVQRQMLNKRILTILEMDDDPLRWEEHYQQSDFAEMRSVHAIQTSTPALADYFRQFNPAVKVIPNYIESLPRLAFADRPEVTIFFGALNREQDWQPIMPALNSILNRQSNKVRVVVVHDRGFFDSLQTEHKLFVPFCDYSRYQYLLQNSDIALLPLLPTRFNRMKSDLKFIESAAWGTAALASPTVYADTIQHGETGLIYENDSEFAEYLAKLIEDAGLRRRLATNAWQWVRKNRLLSLHYRERLEWYESLFDRYDELTTAIEERVPEMLI